MEYRRKRTAWLHYQSGSAGDPADHCRDGLADGLVSASVSTGPKMAGSLAGQQSGPKEKSGGGHRSAADRRSVAAGNWTSDGPRTQPGDDRGLRSLKMVAEIHFKWGSAPNPVFGGNLLFLGDEGGSTGRKRF